MSDGTVARYDIPSLNLSFLIIDDDSPLGSNILKSNREGHERKFLDFLGRKNWQTKVDANNTMKNEGWLLVPLLRSVFLSELQERSSNKSYSQLTDPSLTLDTLQMLTINLDKNLGEFSSLKNEDPRHLGFIHEEDVIEVFM